MSTYQSNTLMQGQKQARQSAQLYRCYVILQMDYLSLGGLEGSLSLANLENLA